MIPFRPMDDQTRKINILDLPLAELQAQLQEAGDPAYRARQVWAELYRQLAEDPQAMTTLPAAMRNRLGETYRFKPLRLHTKLVSADGFTRKFLFLTADEFPVETVWMSYERRDTVCVSVQSGCPIGCPFCATGRMGLRRSLRPGEILAQIFHVARALRDSGGELTNVVLMGMGEAFLNYESTLAAVDRLTDPEGFQFGARRITISTVGIVPGIRRFASEKRQVNLAVSLHAADDTLRDQLVPINRTYPLEELFAACDDYIRLTNRRLSFEWALIGGINDTAAQANRLADLIRKRLEKALVHVNLIPLNRVEGYAGGPAGPERANAFRAVLDEAGIPCTIRLARGTDIAAGCGQLAGMMANSEI